MKKWTFLLVAMLVTLSLLPSGCAKKENTLAIAVSGQGTTVPATGTYTCQDGQSVTISATPASGWKFDGWSGDASGTNGTLSLLMNEKKGITANFSKITYNLTLAVNGNGTTSPSAGARIYDAGTAANITANPSTGWKFDGWSGDVAGSNTTVSFRMDGNKNLAANFSKITYNLTLAVTGNGTTSPSAGARIYDAGTAANITANPSTGWKFDSWSGGVAAPSLASTTVTLDSNKTVTANFSPTSQDYQPYSLNIGTGSGDWNFGSINTGDRVQFSFQAAGSTVSYLVLGPNGNSVLSTSGYGQSGGGSFVAATSGDYKLHFMSNGLPTSVITIRYTVYLVP